MTAPRGLTAATEALFATPLNPPAAGSATPHAIGIDLSMRSTGLASSLGWTERVTSTGRRGDDLSTQWVRLKQIVNSIEGLAKNADLAIIEGPSYGSAGSSAGTWDRAGLWWLVVDRLRHRGIPVAVVPPASRCRYATGRGNASKDEVLAAAIRRFPDFDITGNDVADAVWLAAAGMDQLGHPLAAMPATHRKALDAVAWPEIGGAS